VSAPITNESFQSFIDHSEALVWILDDDDNITYASPGVQTHLGWRPASLVGSPGDVLIPPEELDLVTAVVKSTIARRAIPSSIEFQALRSDAARVWVSGSVVNLADDPAVNGTMINVRNVNGRRLAEEQLLRGSFFDDLTGLPTRALFSDRLDQALMLGKHELIVKVVFIDIDNFGEINRTVGFGGADELLRQFAERLAGCLPTDAIVGRFQNDEFLVARVSAESNRGELVGAVNRMLQHPFALDETSVQMSVAMGLATTTRTETTADELIRKAATAAHEAKRHGPAQAVTYSAPLDARAAFRRETESELRKAIDAEELRVHFQPVLDIATTAVVGIEALVRWEHPSRGLIPPSEFITIAEETGLIVPIGDWVLAQTLAEIADINASGNHRLFASINTSPRQLGDPQFVQSMHAALSRVGLDPSLVHLDVTEASIQGEDTPIGNKLRRLHHLGIEIAIDDFGTGYSSLSNLRKAPANYLKIDRAFTNEVGAGGTEIVVGIIAIAHALNLTPIAEGVETEEQFTTLRQLGCAYSQGYLHARPMPAAELREYLADHRLRSANDAATSGGSEPPPSGPSPKAATP